MTIVQMRVYTSWQGRPLKPGDELDVPADVAERWQRRGIADVVAQVEREFEDYTVPELRAYATEHDIDLGEATRKADIIAAIRRAESGETEPNGADEGAQGPEQGTQPEPSGNDAGGSDSTQEREAVATAAPDESVIAEPTTE